MHVLFVTGEYPPQTGGVGAYTRELARALVQQGVDCSVLTSKASGAESGMNEDGIQVLPVVDKWGISTMRLIGEIASERTIEWLHVQYQTAAFGMNGAVNLAPQFWRSRAKVAWTYHDLLPPYLFPKAGSWLRNWVTMRPALSAQAVIATNAGDWTRLQQRMGGSATRLHNIPIGSNIAGVRLTSQERENRRARHDVTSAQLLLGYFGALNRSKGANVLLQTLDALVESGIDAHLLMIGDALGASDPTNADYAAEVHAMIARMGLATRIHWTGRESEEEVGADLNAIDIAYLPYTDGASLRRGTLMAALANGCAIITTEPAAPIPELIAGRDLLYVARSDESETVRGALAAIQTLRTDAVRADALRASARERSTLFTWQAIAARHLAIYAANE